MCKDELESNRASMEGEIRRGLLERLPGGAGHPSPGTRQDLWSYSLVTNNQNMKKHLFSSSPTCFAVKVCHATEATLVIQFLILLKLI